MFDGMISTASSGQGAWILNIAFRQDLLDYVSQAKRVPRHESPDPNPYKSTLLRLKRQLYAQILFPASDISIQLHQVLQALRL